MTVTADTLAAVMGNVPGVDYAALFPHYVKAMLAADCTNPRRSAAWHSQIGHESGGLRWMAEIEKSNPKWNADRTRYRGRGPIQLTWSGNYRKFGQWCVAMGYITDSELFVNQPELVELPEWGFLAASWYWLFGGPRAGRINEFADAGDIFAVSRCVNGWSDNPDGSPRIPNGMDDRRKRWDDALAMGDAIVPAAAGNDDGGSGVGFKGDPIWLEDVLRADLGDRLVVHEGWAERGVGGVMGDIWGVMIHHTGNVNERVEVIRDGVNQAGGGWLPGPLSQGLITPDGKFHLVAIGPCNHAGGGNYGSLTQGNRDSIGFECAYSGSGDWPQQQVITMRDATAAILRRLGHDGSRVCGHKEYAKPAGRKVDPGNMSMDWFRGEVQKDLDGFVFPGEQLTTVPPQPGPTVPPNYEKEIWDQVRLEWPQLGDQTVVNALGELRDKILGVDDYAKWKAGQPK